MRLTANIFPTAIVGWQYSSLGVKNVHFAKVEEKADRKIAAVRMIGASESKLQPVSKSFFNSYVHVVACDGAAPTSGKQQWGPPNYRCPDGTTLAQG
jgi:hypothetical protein